MDTKKQTSVKSPASSIEGTTANAGGMPETWDCKKIWDQATPPNKPAGNSTTGVGNLNKE